MNHDAKCGSIARRRDLSRLAAIGLAAALGLLGTLVPRAAAQNIPPLLTDIDNDGLADDFETYLRNASTAPEHESHPLNGDSDGDGQPDGFEYCLSGGLDVYTPNAVYPVEPRVTIASHQSGTDLILSVLMTFVDVEDITEFHMYAAAIQPSGPVVNEITHLIAPNLESIGVVEWQGYMLGIMQIRLPLFLVESNGSLALAAVARISEAAVGDSATYTVGEGTAYRWRFYKHYASGGNGQQQAGGTAEPQKAQPADTVPNQVCGTTDIEEPTTEDSVLTRIAVSVGCQGGPWSCSGSICSQSGSAGQPRAVLDVDKLLN